ncbi:MAG: 50S ribosomal protein L2 [Candidatus Bilamarchaeaceae archaeon]
MGKRLKSQRRGQARGRYLATTHGKTDLSYRNYDDIEKTGVLRAHVTGLIDDPARTAPLMAIRYENGETGYLLAPEGIAIGDVIDVGVQGRLLPGSVLPLYRIPDGTYVFNIEKTPGDGGKFVKTAGSYAVIVSREKDVIYVKLPSKKIVMLSGECRAQVGVVAGGGRLEKPLLKAGAAYYKYRRALKRYWPSNRGVHMAAYCHPHGGKQHHVGKPTTVGRGAPAGAKVGHIAARATGRKKGKQISEQKSEEGAVG